MKPDDHIGKPCDCIDCEYWGVSSVPIRRDPQSGKWLHGRDLKRWQEAHETFLKQARAAVGAKGRHAAGFEPLARKDP